MIIDQLSNAHLYEGIGKRVAKGLRYLQETDFSKMEPGRYEIDGDHIYAFVQHYNTKPAEEGLWEAHKVYLDLQYVAAGEEKMGYSNLKQMEIIEEYNVLKDSSYFQGDGNFILCKEGTFTLLFPDDVHLPRICVNDREPVIKVVLKIAI